MVNKEGALEFWSSKLQAAEPCILTLSNRSTAVPSSSAIESVTINLSGIGTPWSEYVNTRDISLSAIFMTAWGMILRTYMDSDEVCFGHAFTARQEPVNGYPSLYRPQLNILPFFLQFEKEGTLLETVRKTRLGLDDAQSKQDVSLAEICGHMGMETNALFNTCMLFSSDEQPSPNAEPDVLAQEVTLMEGCPQFDIIVHVSSSKQCILLYQKHCLSKDQAVHIAGALRVALTSIINSPHLAIEKVEIFSPVDENKLLQWNKTAPIASESCLHDLIKQQCDLHPDSLAVVAWDGSFTYRELDHLSNTLAQKLCLTGIGPDIFVAICADRCKWIPVAMLGIIKAGGAFCALDPSHPPSRLREMCKALGSSMVITTVDDAKKADQLALTAIVLGNDLRTEPNGTKFSPGRAPLYKTQPSNALYSVFTSGSSGNPKGVVIEHRSFASTALASLKPLDIRPQDRILHFASYAFDLSVFEVLAAFTAGASVAIPSEKARMECLPRAATELQATWTFLTPTVARMYRPSDFPTLRTISLGGELVQTSDIELWGSKNLITGYNPAECCPLGISGPANLSEANFIGWPFASHAAWVVDTRDFQKLVPVGAIGELIIEGPAVARCYLHDKNNALPDSPFISPPQWLSRFRGKTSPDIRLYQTGDLVRYGCNGAVHYIGRKDFQIKIRGQRVELEEIESQLRNAFSAGNHRVAVEAVKLSGSTTLVAFISMNSSDSETKRDASPAVRLQDITQELETYVEGVVTNLRGILPASMIPAAFLPVTHIPVSKSGKVDRKQLRSLASSLSPEVLFRPKGESTSGNLPETDDERRLQALFALVLGISPSNITADSDFFRLGGDSALAMKLLALVSQEERFDLTYSDIFQHPRLRDMLNASRSRSSFMSNDNESVSTESSLPPFFLVKDANSLIDIASDQCGINKENIEDIYPCTSTQANLMASTALDEDPCVSIRSFKLESNIDKARVEQAWRITSKGHPILRTRIIQSNTGAFFQVVIKGDICWSDYTDSDDSNSQFRPSFGLGSPSVQLCIMKGRLLVAMHHVLYDSWSLPRLLNEVDEAYCQLSVQRLPPLNCYVKHVAESLDSAASFWKAELEDAEPTHFPELPSNKTDQETISTTTKSIGTTMPIDSERKSNVEFELQLAWAITCYSYTKNEDVIFGVISSGRNIPLDGVDKMLGPIFAITPLRVPIDPAQEVAEAIEDLQYRSEEQAPYTHLGLHRISQLGQKAAAACQFQTLLVVEPNETAIKGTWFCEHEVIYNSIEPRHHSLTLKCLIKPSFVDITAIFHQSILPDTQKQDMLLRFQHIFRQIHASGTPDSTIMDIDTASPQDLSGLQHSSLFVKNVGRDYTTTNKLHNRGIFLSNSTPKSQIHHSLPMVDNALEEAAQAQNSPGPTSRRPESQQFAQASEAVNLVAEIDRYDRLIASAQQEEMSDSKRSPQANNMSFNVKAGRPITVFLTGANGFIGTEVLRQLLENHDIRRVIALVRGRSTHEVRSRTIDSAKRALWWTDSHGEKLDVWPGDLSLPHLGLDAEHWSMLEDGTTVDAVIHNGASVHWLKNYTALEATNVRSTAELLRIAVKMPHVRFTYVSSGRYQDPVEEIEEQMAMQFAAGGIPYSQTKFVAESLVRRAAARIPSGHSNLAVASLGLVIGTPTEGVVNSDDYIWRLVAACIKAGVCNADELDKWFPVSDVARTASTIIDTVLEPMTTSAPVKQVTGGITWREIWNIVMEMGYTVESRPAVDCLRAIRQDIEVEREKHPLWTLAQMIEGRIDNTEPMWATSWHGNEAASVRLKGAVKRSIAFLGEIGFIPKSSLEVQEQVQKIHRGAFSRS